ncbi:hypothetical protein [Clostridium estertheticum]|uniref:hypothetical protein n=1 Tax=Clostridium estertheticum TaxID=238834 RepID=UPI001CF23C3D|nr:hypothetical protein [Clostridium estertheticum]MCB2354361.1 hypothetical protein [Clostridium estertheticum]WAG42520.1 hypothetical protein LL065_07560 [Clostridium estertheticum]
MIFFYNVYLIAVFISVILLVINNICFDTEFEISDIPIFILLLLIPILHLILIGGVLGAMHNNFFTE